MAYPEAVTLLFEECDCPAIRWRAFGRAEDRQALVESAEMRRLLEHGALAARSPELHRNVHGRTARHLENLLPMLLERGLDGTCPAFDAAFAPLLPLFDKATSAHGLGYYLPIVLAPWLLWAGYRTEGLLRFWRERLAQVAAFCAQGDYAIYADSTAFSDVPSNFRSHHVLKSELYAGGCNRLPMIYDLYACRAFLSEDDDETRSQTEQVIAYVLSPTYQKLDAGYGLLREGPRHYCVMGWDARLPSLENGLNAPALHRLELLAGLPVAENSPWMARALALLAQARRDDGVYELPPTALTKREGYWVTGAHMSLGEDRHMRRERLACGTLRAYRVLDQLAARRLCAVQQEGEYV